MFAPFTVIVFGNAKALGFGKDNVGEEGGETMMRERNSPGYWRNDLGQFNVIKYEVAR